MATKTIPTPICPAILATLRPDHALEYTYGLPAHNILDVTRIIFRCPS